MSNEFSSKSVSHFSTEAGHEYVIGSQLGTGSSGTVFTCSDESGSVFAVKVVKLHHMKLSMTGEEYEEEKQKLEREVNILRHLSHPNIVKLIDVANGKDCVYVVQELVEGGELFGRITEDADFRHEGVVKFVYCQLADAVLYLHSKSVIHRDIKPENILVQSSLRVLPPGFAPVNLPIYPVIKLVDFGLSKEISSLSNMAQTWVGTPQYWAPEVITAREKGTPYDGRSDIWSMGVLLFVALCRRYPFSEPKYPGDPSMQDLILKGEFQFPAKCVASENSRDLVRRLVEPDLGKRISIEGTFTHPWLQEFPQGKLLACRWPLGTTLQPENVGTHVLDVNNSGLVSDPSENHPGYVSEPSEEEYHGLVSDPSDKYPGLESEPSSPVGLVSEPTTSRGQVSIETYSGHNVEVNDIVPFLFPSSSPRSILPNIALAQKSAADQFQLQELAAIQNEIITCFMKIQNNFDWGPGPHALMVSLASRSRELQFVSATTIGKFAITAELAEAVIEDSSAFVQAGAVEASLSCVEEIRTSVADMLTQCKNVQEMYRALVEDVHQVIDKSRLAITDIDAPISASLLASSLRDLRRVDEILGKCRFFWSNVEQCLLRLDQSGASYRLLANVHLSASLMDRYNVRVTEHKAFWERFRETCAEYAKLSQKEFQKVYVKSISDS